MSRIAEIMKALHVIGDWHLTSIIISSILALILSNAYIQLVDLYSYFTTLNPMVYLAMNWYVGFSSSCKNEFCSMQGEACTEHEWLSTD